MLAPRPPPPLCDFCTTNIFHPSSIKQWITPQDAKQRYCNFRRSLNQIHTSTTKAGPCAMCQVFCNAIEVYNRQALEEERFVDREKMMHFAISSASREKGKYWRGGGIGDLESMWVTVNAKPMEVYTAFAEKDDPAAKFVSQRDFNLDYASDENFALAAAWLDNCAKNHPECGGSEITDLPTRLVDVGTQKDGDSVRLHVTSGGKEKGKYIALSYCWGKGVQESATLVKNLSMKMKGFKMSSLPMTIQDAIVVTRKLGMRYIWIDSLCILQDSTADKAVEIANMNNIYRHAYLTIIAERAKDASEGFLKPKSPSLSGLGKIFKIPYPNPNATDVPYKPTHGTLCLRRLEDYQYNALHEAINKRGWTFEERILSRRRLLYSTKQLRWQCGKAQHTNAGAAEERFNEVSMKPMSEILRPAKAAGAKRPVDPLSHMGKQWSAVINEYTDRNLTMPGDKLLAVGGLATEFNRTFGDQYIAGMWKSQMFKSLQWNSAPSAPEFVKPRPKGYRAPSWSWAATDNRVLFSAYSEPSGITGKEVMKLLDFGVTLAAKVAPFGQVTAGFIKVRGTLKQVAWDYDRATRQYVLFDVDDDVGYDDLGWAYPDSREDAALKEVWALPILEELGSNGPTGMLLMPVEGKKGYWRRVGYFILWEKRDREWLYDETDEVVTLHII